MDTAVNPRGMRIGELAKRLGTTTKTLRFYEQISLLGAAGRSESAYRLYDDDAVATARLVIGLRHLELSISELQDLLRDDDLSARHSALLLATPRTARSTACATRCCGLVAALTKKSKNRLTLPQGQGQAVFVQHCKRYRA